MPVETIQWSDGLLRIVDQTLLPRQFVTIPLLSLESVWRAIKTLQVRGAPAIGVCAAFGVLVGVREQAPADLASGLRAVLESADYLATSRPTAVNLFWALDRMRLAARSWCNKPGADGDGFAGLWGHLEREALAILEEDRVLCRRIGAHGAELVRDGMGILTHCNAGGLATADYGTALAVMFRAHEEGKRFEVFADETRPLLQGARLTAWELMQAGIPATLICDNMAAQVMREDRIHMVVVGADRIAANGDTANKIGTYSVALLAKAHGIPFYVAAPYSTFDLTIPSGDHIVIEQRAPEEVTEGFGVRTAPEGVAVYNPAFDVTPASLITGFITEEGILSAPYGESIAALRPVMA